MTDQIVEESDLCTCKNRTLTTNEVMMVINPYTRTGVVFAKDCPIHGMRDLTDYSKLASDINHTDEESNKSG